MGILPNNRLFKCKLIFKMYRKDSMWTSLLLIRFKKKSKSRKEKFSEVQGKWSGRKKDKSKKRDCTHFQELFCMKILFGLGV